MCQSLVGLNPSHVTSESASPIALGLVALTVTVTVCHGLSGVKLPKFTVRLHCPLALVTWNLK